ncbi:MAG: tetratricopeptide repeat protein [bacterium]
MGFRRIFLIIPLLFSVSVFAELIDEADEAYSSGDYAGALPKYTSLVEQNRKDTRALLGLGRIYLAQGDIKSAAEVTKKGLRYTRSRSNKLDLYALAIRIEGARGERNKARSQYRKAKGVRGSKEHAEIHLAMAKVYLQNREFEDAEELLKISLSIDSKFNKEAEMALTNLQLIEKAVAVTDSDFAFSATVTREEIAELLIHDLELAAKLGNPNLSQPSVGETSDQGLTDYVESEYKDVILSVHRLGLRSFRIRNGAFLPHKAITRVELALLIEDVLYSKYDISRTQFIGTRSPFSDLSSNSTGFNAMMTAVTRGLMQGNQSGMIHPDELVSGAEAILVVHNLDSMLNQS